MPFRGDGSDVTMLGLQLRVSLAGAEDSASGSFPERAINPAFSCIRGANASVGTLRAGSIALELSSEGQTKKFLML
jgi:hypothetical protein